MSQELEGMSIEKLSIESIEPLTWFQTWVMAFFHPSVSTFQQIAIDPNATIKRSILWVVGGNLIGHIILNLIGGWFGVQQKLGVSELIRYGITAVLSFLLVTWITHLIATKLFHGNGEYVNLTNAFAASYAPYSLLSGAIVGIPTINLLIIPLIIYALALGATAASAVYEVHLWKAVFSFMAALVIVIGIIVVLNLCIVIFTGPDLLEEFQKMKMDYEA